MTAEFQDLIDHISKYIALNDVDVQNVIDAFEMIKVKKNTLLETENQLTKYLYFIHQGFVRVFYVKEGEERSTNINCPSRFITSYKSFITASNAYDNVETVTDCSLLRISKENLEILNDRIENWSFFAGKIYEQALIYNEERTRDMILLTAEQRYQKLFQTEPEIIKYVPLQYIASYIGIKPESLSRIRRQLNS